MILLDQEELPEEDRPPDEGGNRQEENVLLAQGSYLVAVVPAELGSEGKRNWVPGPGIKENI